MIISKAFFLSRERLLRLQIGREHTFVLFIFAGFIFANFCKQVLKVDTSEVIRSRTVLAVSEFASVARCPLLLTFFRFGALVVLLQQ